MEMATVTEFGMLRKIANRKESILAGTLTGTHNVSNEYIGVADLEDPSYHDIVLEVKIEQTIPSDESSKDFVLFWGFSSQGDIGNNSPDYLQPVEFSLICDLVNASLSNTTRYYQTSIIQPKARYLYLWYDCDKLNVQLNVSNVNGTFQTDETVTGGTSNAQGTIVSVSADYLIVNVTSGTFQAGETITGGTSGATATIDSINEGVNVSIWILSLIHI